MFEVELPTATAITALDDAGLIDAVVGTSKLDSMVLAKRFVAIGELWDRRQRQADPEVETFALDTFDRFAAELSAAMGITPDRAGTLIRTAEALHNRLPNVRAAFERAELDYWLVSAIVNRTELIDEPDRLARVDAALAKRAGRWSGFSRNKITELVDSWVTRFDPEGVRAPRERNHSRFLDIRPTYKGMAGIWGAVSVPDAVVLDQRIDELVGTVCPNDPRTRSQLRADAMRALAERADRMACQCGMPDCSGERVKPADNAVIHVLAESSTVEGSTENPGYVMGFGPVNAETVRELARSAKLKPLDIPEGAAESGYRPSVALAEFVRWRDLTCRFPGCDKPAEACDLDHTTPHPAGPTHPSNLKAYCRKHHLLKTFCSGWNDRQLADGTIVFTSPTGHVYTTKPGGSLFFPALVTATGQPPPAMTARGPCPGRMVMMPRRERTRAQDRAYRIARERRDNAERLAAAATHLADERAPF